MKKRRVLLVSGMAAALAFMAVLAGCASVSNGPKAVIDTSIVAGNGGASVNVSYDSPKRPPTKVDVFVDGFIYLTLSAGKAGQFVVPDGEHSIYAIETGLIPNAATTKLQFTAASKEMSFTVFNSNSGFDIKRNN
jgi:hypothetical protein